MGNFVSKIQTPEALAAFSSVYEQNKNFWIISVLLGSGGLFYYVYSKLFGKKKNLHFSKSKRTKKRHKTAVDAQFFQQVNEYDIIWYVFVWQSMFI